MATASDKDFEGHLGTIRADMEKLTKVVSKLADEGARTQAAVAKSVKGAARKASHAGEEAWDEMTSLGSGAAEATANAARAGLSTIEKQILRSPLTAVLVASGIGFLIGLYNHR